MTEELDKDGHRTTFQYSNGKPVGAVDANGDSLFDLSNPENWATNDTTLALTLMRQYTPSTTSKIDGRGNLWKYDYNENGYITQITAPDGATTKYTYDPKVLKVASEEDANGHKTQYKYDTNNPSILSRGNLIQKTDALNHPPTTYEYEPVFNNIIKMTDPNGRVTTYEYDSKGNRIKETDPLGYTLEWTYNAKSNVLTEKDKNSNVTCYEYDAYGNRSKMTQACGQPIARVTLFFYNIVGNLRSRTDANSHTTTYDYDGLNRLIKETDPVGNTTQTFYDSQGNRIKVIDRNGNVTQYEHDQRNRLVKTIDALVCVTTQSYDGNNNLISSTDKNGHTTQFQYDVQNRQNKTIDALGNTSSRTYDGVGNLLSETDANGHTTTYGYDALNRRIKATDAIGCVTLFGYDLIGLPFCANCTGPTLSSSLITQQTDGNGKVTYFAYDGLDRLTKQIRKQTDTLPTIDGDDAVTSYTYDPNGNRLTMTVGC